MTETTTPNSSPVASAELSLDLIITCADGLEAPLQTELTSFGIASEIKSTGRLAVTGTLRDLYTICLWSRVASRVLMLIKRKNINTEYDVAEQLYGLAKSVDWTEQFKLEQTFAIRLSVDKRVAVSQQFAMLRIKDAIADTFNEVYDSRPNVDSKNPDFSVFATVNDKQAELYLDLSGTSLHRRGYRVAMTEAPLKENLAAALLYSAGWHKKNEQGNAPLYNALIDPMCGSGTFIIEALLMHCDYAVGIDKAANQFGFYQWQHHDDALWQQMIDDAQTRFRDALAITNEQPDTLPLILGFDADSGAIFNLIMILAIMSLIGSALTLPGIAGIVLTIGMAVDANVLIFERIREELANGARPKSAIVAGFNRAFTSIFDAQLTTLIVAFILFAIGTGPIKGFAVTLAIGIASSIFTSVTVTRALVQLAYGYRKNVKRLSIG